MKAGSIHQNTSMNRRIRTKPATAASYRGFSFTSRDNNKKNGRAKWKSTTDEGAQWCAENMKAHPDWNASAWDGCPGT